MHSVLCSVTGLRLSLSPAQLIYIKPSAVEVAGQALAASAASTASEGDVSKKTAPPVYDYFDFVKSGKHVQTARDGTETEWPCKWYRCKKANSGGCKVKGSPPIKVVRAATNGLLKHLLVCEGREVWLDVRAKSKGSLVYRASDGKVVTRLSFKELLPHHARFVIYCFLAWDKFSKTRSPAFKTYIEGWEVRARLPHRETCIKLLFIIKHLIKHRLYQLLAMMKMQFGSPTCGLADDIWSKRNCKQSFACARIPMSIDGDLLDSFCKAYPSAQPQYSGQIVSCSPVLAFSTLPSSRHTGHVIKRWKEKILMDTGVLTVADISLATEDGASNNKKSNKLLRMPSIVCFPHDLQRCVLLAAGLSGSPCRNPALQKFQARSSKMVGSFSKSGVAQSELFDSQRADEDWGKVLSLSSPNATRWLGLHRQAQRNRELQPHLCKALCGTEDGKEDSDDDEIPVPDLSDSGSGMSDEDEQDKDSDSSDDDVIESSVRADKEHPLKHRLLSQDDFKVNAQFESVLSHAAEVSALLQSHDGTRLEEAQLFMITLAQVMEAPRIQVVSGRGESESWDEMSASRLHPMFQDFRSIFVQEANARFHLKGTPNEHVLLCLKMNPFIDHAPDGPFGKRATQELMNAVYMTRLRARQQELHRAAHAPTLAPNLAPAPAPAPAPGRVGAPESAPAPAPASESAPAGLAPGTSRWSAVLAPKKRQKICGLASAMHIKVEKPDSQHNADQALKDEIATYEKVQASLDHSKYVFDGNRYDLNAFWAAYKHLLPIHYRVYLGDCGSKRAASASVETVYSGATKLSDGSDSLADDVLAAYIFCHYNWKFEFLRPSIPEIVAEYLRVRGPETPQEEEDADDEEEEGEEAESPQDDAPPDDATGATIK